MWARLLLRNALGLGYVIVIYCIFLNDTTAAGDTGGGDGAGGGAAVVVVVKHMMMMMIIIPNITSVKTVEQSEECVVATDEIMLSYLLPSF